VKTNQPPGFSSSATSATKPSRSATCSIAPHDWTMSNLLQRALVELDRRVATPAALEHRGGRIDAHDVREAWPAVRRDAQARPDADVQ
jgi:hypothetical protein